MKAIIVRFFMGICLLINAIPAFGAQVAGDSDLKINSPTDGRKQKVSENSRSKKLPDMKKGHFLSGDKIAYGVLLYDDYDTDNVNNLVSFDPLNSGTFTKERTLGMYISAGAYANGKYYFSSSYLVGEKEMPGRFYEMEIGSDAFREVNPLSGFDNFVNDMSFDYSTGTMYALAKLNNGNSALYSIALKDASIKKIADLDRHFFTLACSYAGQLYAVSRTGDFCKINKTSGAVEVVGPTGLKPSSIQSMEFDHTDKTLYWAACLLGDQESCMATLDVKTGKATVLGSLGVGGEIAGLYIPFKATTDGAPAAVTEMTVSAGGNGLPEATLQWKNPTQTFDGFPLGSAYKIEIYRNDQLVYTKENPVPGAKQIYVDPISPSNGMLCTYKIVPVNANGKGIAQEYTLFIGKDVPEAPRNLHLNKTGIDQVSLAWEAPQTGMNKGWIDQSSVVYKVVRLPDNKLIAEKLSSATCEDKMISPVATYSYQVIAMNAQGQGGLSQTGKYLLGPQNTLPYFGDFGNQKVVDSWSIVNNNGDNRAWINDYYLDLKKNVMSYEQSGTLAADDWLISHSFLLEKGEQYKVSFMIETYAANNLRFVLGKDADVATMTQEIKNYKDVRCSVFTPFNFTFSVAETGTYHLGLQLYSAKNSSWVYLQNINVEKIVPNDLAAVSLKGNINPVLGHSYGYGIEILNKGTQPQQKFTIRLRDAGNNTVLVSRDVQRVIQPEEIVTETINWTPASAEVRFMVGEIILQDDEVGSNNFTDTLSVTVMPKGSSETIRIGGRDKYIKDHPLNFYETKSAAMNIYLASEIGQKGGVIEKVTYLYNNGSGKLIENAPVKIYLGNTERSNTMKGWCPKDSMTLVYDGLIKIDKGTGELQIPFDKYFVYEGKNLAVLTVLNLTSTYYSNVLFPVYVSPGQGNFALTWKGYSTPFDFSVAGKQSTTNSAATFTMLCDGAILKGAVEDINIPLDSVEVTLVERKTTVMSDRQGNFTFDYLPDGRYTLRCVKHGYPDVEIAGIEITGGTDVTRNIRMTNLPTYRLEGVVTDNLGNPLSGATIAVAGYDNLKTISSAEGKFVFDRVLAAENYELAVRKEWYQTYIRKINVLENTDLNSIRLEYATYSPVNASATAEGEKLHVKWESPDKPVLFKYDDHTVSGQTGITNATGNTALGSVYRVPAVLKEVSWFTTSEGGPHNIMQLLIYDLDKAGNPKDSILYSAKNIPNKDNQWNSYTLPGQINAPNGFMIALNYPGYIGLGVDSGTDVAYPFENEMYYYSMNYEGGEFASLSKIGLDKNLLIRGSGYVLPHNYESSGLGSQLPEQPIGVASFWKYKVWRFLKEDQENIGKWNLITASAVTETTIEDSGWKNLSPGVYRYAVSVIYPDGSVSPEVYTPFVANRMETKVVVNVKTNGKTGSAEGAVVVLKDGKGKELTCQVGVDNEASFDNVWKGIYEISVSLSGYDEVNATEDFSLKDEYTTQQYILKESITTPRNLNIRKEENSVLFSWNLTDPILEGFEGHEDFAIDSPGQIGWKYIDGDGSSTYSFRNNRFPGEYDSKAYIVFNPASTSPAMTDIPEIQPHSGSKFLACFSSETVNDDYLISPELNFADDFILSFYAKSYSDYGGYADVFSVGYSLNGSEPDDFVWLDENVTSQVENWQKYSYTIPAQARYVTIHCVSANGFVLMIDDVYLGDARGEKIQKTADNTPDYVYEVYLDGKKVAETTDYSYRFSNISGGEHIAGVKCTYYSGSSELVTYEFDWHTGINSATSDQLSVFPNPSNEYVKVSGDYAMLELQELNGRTLAIYERNQDVIDVSQLPEGIYLLVVTRSDKQSRKVFKVNIVR